MRSLFLIIFISFNLNAIAQQFLNPDLEGTVGVSGSLVSPDHWESIPASYTHCDASDPGLSDTPDLVGPTGPDPEHGIHGIPYSGVSFISGLLARTDIPTDFHEGIFQTVSGFTIDSFYTISFYQSVVKQEHVLDTTGGWSVYLDTQLMFNSPISKSSLAYDNLALSWDHRIFTFRARSNSHTFYFLPYDDDLNRYNDDTYDGALRMGIDSISLRPICHLEEELADNYSLCHETNTTLNVLSPNANYLWSTGETTPSITATEGDYSVTITGENGCFSHDQTTIKRNPVTSIDLGPDRYICNNNSFSINAITSGASYLWQDSSNYIAHEVNESGLYWVEVSLMDCINRDSILVLDHPIADFSLGPDTTFCNGDTIILTPTPSLIDLNYIWSDGSTNSSNLIFAEDSIWVTAFQDGCYNSDTIYVTPIFPSFSLGTDTTLCNGESLILDATLPDSEYGWQDGSTSSTYDATEEGVYTVDITKNGCTLSDTIEIMTLNLNSLDLGADTTICPNTSLILSADIPGAAYSWQNQSIASEIEINSAGLYWVTASINHCNYRDSITIYQHPLTSVDLGEEVLLCYEESLIINVEQNNASYEWQDGSTTTSYEIMNPGTYWVEVSLADCTSRDTLEVAASLLEPFNLGPDTTLCQGESMTLSPSLIADNYLWSDNSNNNSLTISQPGTFNLSASLENCTEQDSITVTFSSLGPITLGPDTTLCPGDSLLLSIDVPEASYLWSDNSTNPSIWVMSGNHSIIVNLGDCNETASISVDHYEPASLSLGQDTTVCAESNFVLQPNLIGLNPLYNWQDGSIQSTYPIAESGLYTLAVETNCTSLYDEVDIAVENCTCMIYNPNIFSPNQDQNNDAFRSYTSCPITDYHLQIFDRWGGLLFETDQITNGWDGQNAISGTYVFSIRYKDRQGIWQQEVGDVTLVR